MKKIAFGIVCMWGLFAPAHADIEVVYGDNPRDEKNIRQVEELKNSYESQIAALQRELDDERAEKQRQLEEREAAEARQAKVDKDYKLSVDRTKKVINHIGAMPESLPGLSSEGVGAPLSAAFNGTIPIDWKVYVHHSLDDGRAISWDSEGRNWVATLYQIGLRYNYSYDINWDENWVLVNESELRLGLSDSGKPDIEIMGLDVPAGKEGHILIDGKIIKVRSKSR